MEMSIIAALDRAGLIGAGQSLPWHLPQDLRRFRERTMGKPLIMGRRTFASIGRPLPGRWSIILTRNKDFTAEGCQVAHSLDEALEQAQDVLTATKGSEVMIVGGAHVYQVALPRAERLYLTLIDGQFQGDAWFPVNQLTGQDWHINQAEFCPAVGQNAQAHLFVILHRHKPTVPLTLSSPAQQLVDQVLRPWLAGGLANKGL